MEVNDCVILDLLLEPLLSEENIEELEIDFWNKEDVKIPGPDDSYFAIATLSLSATLSVTSLSWPASPSKSNPRSINEMKHYLQLLVVNLRLYAETLLPLPCLALIFFSLSLTLLIWEASSTSARN